jgi:cell cycle sensor histidine kinase DivJ
VAVVALARSYLDTVVHPAARGDALAAARHRAFIARRVFGGTTVLAAVPVYLTLRGLPSGLELAVLGWLLAEIGLAFFLSRTGRYRQARIMSALALGGLIALLAWWTAGAMALVAALCSAILVRSADALLRNGQFMMQTPQATANNR